MVPMEMGQANERKDKQGGLEKWIGWSQARKGGGVARIQTRSDG